jgi:hypothetical protein
MNLPNAESAIVPMEKVVDYLLNPAHPDGAGKAQFFGLMGFRREEWQVLASALRRLAAQAEVTRSLESRHGRKYVLDGRIETPAGRTPLVRTVWIVDAGTEIPRLVSAYPQEEKL